MRYLTKIGAWAIIMLALGGCGTTLGGSDPSAKVATAPAANPQPAAAPVKQGPSGDAPYLAHGAVAAAADAPGDSAVDTALLWAQKYSEASEKIVRLQDENRRLVDDQRQLKEQIVKLQTELSASAQQIQEANNMLMEMRTELENWKTNVLGYRQEMRDAQQTQMKALAKILVLVGGSSAADEILPAAPTTKGAASEPNH